ncbi:MAG TPA: ABC transporter substrate binding protein, partial [Deltaproteobacteria bacterium]|nr:ABC transporter substrate binding protein [Deltaproteobacteria bacterium]
MRRLFIGLMSFLVVFLMTDAGFAQQKTFTIEVLQVTNVEPFERVYQGFMQELSAAGLVEGQNLKVNRRIIDFDVEKGGLWKKVGVLFEIKSTASKIVEARPDLVLTVGTPATKYAKDKIVAAGIPLVFTAVAIPEAAGCKSLTVAGPGFTGATLYLDMADALKIARLAFPDIKTVGIVHTDDDNTLAQV